MYLPVQPLRFEPVFRSYIWGGNRLASQLGKKTPDGGIWAESWEIVDHREGQSIVVNGPFAEWTLRKLMESFPREMLGVDSPDERFPLLLKYLDCQRVLSVQVHPDDAYGATMPQPDRGKTEAWYVIDAEPGAKLYAGLKPDVDRKTLEQAIRNGTTEQCLHVLCPKPGDCVFIPAGTVHALGAGLLVAEIQQASDCTFRLFDWNRVDQSGLPRPLHVEQALSVIDFHRGPVSFVEPEVDCNDGSEVLVKCDKFVLRKYSRPGSYRLPMRRATILTTPRGRATVQSGSESYTMTCGQTLFLPFACQESVLTFADDSVVLASTLPETT